MRTSNVSDLGELVLSVAIYAPVECPRKWAAACMEVCLVFVPVKVTAVAVAFVQLALGKLLLNGKLFPIVESCPPRQLTVVSRADAPPAVYSSPGEDCPTCMGPGRVTLLLRAYVVREAVPLPMACDDALKVTLLCSCPGVLYWCRIECRHLFPLEPCMSPNVFSDTVAEPALETVLGLGQQVYLLLVPRCVLS